MITTIRKATRKDALRALRIRSEAILDQCAGHYSPEVLEAWADAKLSEGFLQLVEDDFYVATADGRIVGSTVAYHARLHAAGKLSWASWCVGLALLGSGGGVACYIGWLLFYMLGLWATGSTWNEEHRRRKQHAKASPGTPFPDSACRRFVRCVRQPSRSVRPLAACPACCRSHPLLALPRRRRSWRAC